MTYKPIVTSSIASQIADAIQQAIVDGALRTNDRLPSEDELAAQFGVSRPTVRDALKRLTARQLIRSRRGPAGGNFVKGPSPEELAESLSVATTMLAATGGVSLDEMATARLELEAMCCRMAAGRIQPDEIAEMTRELDGQASNTISDEEFCASDVRFHQLIARASGNPIFRFVMNLVVVALMPVSNMLIVHVRDRQIIVGFHRRIVAALERGDGEEAVSALSALVAYIRAQYEKAERGRAKRLILAEAEKNKQATG